MSYAIRADRQGFRAVNGPDDVDPDEYYSETPIEITPPSESVEAAIAARRYRAETGGTVFNGTRVDTDDRSKTLINGSALKAMRNSSYILIWKTPEGFIQMPADQVLAMADAVADHVQACFDREDELLSALADGSFQEDMLEQGWP